jgi:hypothetical protein
VTNLSHRPKHAPRVPFALLVTGLIVGGMCALLGLNTASAANELARHDLAVKDAGIAAQLQQLQNDVAASAAPGALGSAAAALGMVPAGDPAFLEIGANGSVRVLGSPGAASAAAAPKPPPPTKPKTSATSTATSTAQGTTAKTTGATTKTSAHPSTTPTPTPTPTPTTTLGGGVR